MFRPKFWLGTYELCSKKRACLLNSGISGQPCRLSVFQYFCSPLMSKVFKNKNVLLVAGLLVGLVTLFSHSLRVEIKSDKIATEKKAETEQQTIVFAPSDAVTVNAFTLQVDGFLEVSPAYQSIKETAKAIPVYFKKTSSLFQTLFRYIISPNAP